MSNKRVFGIIITISIIILIFFLLMSQNRKQKTYRETRFELFDTVTTITLIEGGNEKILEECFEIIERYEKLFSKYADSEISRLADSSTVSFATADIIRKGLEYGEVSGGLFDITIGTVSALWNIQERIIPTDDDLAEALKYVDYTKIKVLDDNTVTLDSPYIKLDLGGIAKGYVVDRITEHLRTNDVTSALIDFGGQLAIIGNDSNGNKNWRVRITDPRAALIGEKREIVAIRLRDKSISTSGIYRRYFEQDGEFYHHILNPKTGRPENNGLLSVTVVSDFSVDCDALSTIFFLMGPDDGFDFAQSMEGIEAIFITENTIKATSGLELEFLE